MGKVNSLFQDAQEAREDANMLVQVITLTFPDGDQTTYVDQVGTEDAAESYFMLDQHLADGDAGTVKVCTLGGVSQ
jgi:hypothetical protein